MSGHQVSLHCLQPGGEAPDVCCLVYLYKLSLSDLHHAQPAREALPQEVQVFFHPI